MQVVTIKVDAMKEGEQVVVDIQYQQKKGEGWNVTKLVTLTSGTGEAERKLIINDDERVIIEGRVTKMVVMDPTQNAAKIVDSDPEVRSAQEQLEAAQKRLNQVREDRGRQVDAALQEAASFAQHRTNLGNPAPSTPPKPGTDPVTGQPTPVGMPKVDAPKAGDTGQGAKDSHGNQGTSTSAPSAQAGGGTPNNPSSPTPAAVKPATTPSTPNTGNKTS